MKKSHTSIKSLTDWERIDNMKEEDIDLSDSPEITPEMFAKAIVRRGLKPVLKKNRSLCVWIKMYWHGSECRGRVIRLLSTPYSEPTWKNIN